MNCFRAFIACITQFIAIVENKDHELHLSSGVIDTEDKPWVKSFGVM